MDSYNVLASSGSAETVFVLTFNPASGAANPCRVDTPVYDDFVGTTIPANTMLVLDGDVTLAGAAVNASAETTHVTGSAWAFASGSEIDEDTNDLGNGMHTALLRTTSATPRRTFTLTFTLAGVTTSGSADYTFTVSAVSLVETTAMAA